jgi:large subunit ribosomal protein L4
MAETTKTTPAATTLPKNVFNVDVNNHELLKLAYDTYLSNSRQASATTLNRGEVSGGGKKPWKQKGTGRARFGSSRNPIWRGGGIVFGPSGNENFTKKLSTTSKRVAVKQALSLANKAKKIVVIDDFVSKEGKTKDTVALLTKHKVDERARVLLVVDVKTDMLLRATNNVQQVKVTRPTYLNVFDILNADTIIISKKSLPMISEWLTAGVKKGDA